MRASTQRGGRPASIFFLSIAEKASISLAVDLILVRYLLACSGSAALIRRDAAESMLVREIPL